MSDFPPDQGRDEKIAPLAEHIVLVYIRVMWITNREVISTKKSFMSRMRLDDIKQQRETLCQHLPFKDISFWSFHLPLCRFIPFLPLKFHERK